jgi:23S rRNA (guanosine2251-2'-O)-methyltransferase
VAEPTGIVYGWHAAASVLERRPADVRRAWFLEHSGDRLGALRSGVATLGIEFAIVGRRELDRICAGGRHQGIALEVRSPRTLDLTELEELVTALGRRTRLLLLDQVEDPRNLGACLRTADAAGMHAVVVPKSRSAKLTPAAVKAAAGAADTVPLAVVPNLARLMRWLGKAGIWIVGTDGSAPVMINEIELAPPVAVVLGAEARGLRRLTRESCDALASIPMYGTVDSLNVSVAAGIVLFELARQAPPMVDAGGAEPGEVELSGPGA